MSIVLESTKNKMSHITLIMDWYRALDPEYEQVSKKIWKLNQTLK